MKAIYISTALCKADNSHLKTSRQLIQSAYSTLISHNFQVKLHKEILKNQYPHTDESSLTDIEKKWLHHSDIAVIIFPRTNHEIALKLIKEEINIANQSGKVIIALFDSSSFEHEELLNHTEKNNLLSIDINIYASNPCILARALNDLAKNTDDSRVAPSHDTPHQNQHPHIAA